MEVPLPTHDGFTARGAECVRQDWLVIGAPHPYLWLADNKIGPERFVRRLPSAFVTYMLDTACISSYISLMDDMILWTKVVDGNINLRQRHLKVPETLVFRRCLGHSYPGF